MNGIWMGKNTGEGEYKEWHSNGRLRKNCFYKDGMKEGEYKRYFSNGQISVRCTYKEDKREYEYKRWHDNGVLYMHRWYKDGEMVADFIEDPELRRELYMKAKEVRDWQKEHFSQDKEAHIESSTEELQKHLEREMKAFMKEKGVKLAKKIKEQNSPQKAYDSSNHEPKKA